MIAKVIKIESGSEFTDKIRRVELKLEDADLLYNHIRISEDKIGIAGLKLDDQIEVTFSCDTAWRGKKS